jgi:holin, SPP1 family
MKRKITVGTVARTAVLVLAIINNVLVIAGKPPLPIENEAVGIVINTTFTTAAALMAWWKNNSFTTAAIEADIIKEKLKEE